MNIYLTPHGEKLLQGQLAHGPYHTPEEVIERALENLASAVAPSASGKTPAEAAAHIRASRKGVRLGGLKIRDLIAEGRQSRAHTKPRPHKAAPTLDSVDPTAYNLF